MGFLGQEAAVWTFFGTEADPFLGSVGVQSGEGVYERHEWVIGVGLQAEPDEEEDDELEADEEEEMRSLTAARGSISGGGGGAALPW